jgi:nucleoside-diphosphate kinase
METTLILLKPDCVTKNLVGEVLARLLKPGFALRGCKMMRLDAGVLREHYAHIADKPFFPDVEVFMSSSPVVAVALAGENVVQRVRDLAGPTDSKKAEPGTIRGDLGEDVMRNVMHASDSVAAAGEELARFFKEGEVF